MKKLLLLLLVLSGTSLIAQNYQNICSPGTTFYKDSANNLQAFRLDSIHPLGNGDTAYISYNAIRDSMSGNCKDTSNGSVLGRKVIITHDGWAYFFNYRKDTVRINTNAAINDSWTFTKLPNHCYIQATMTGTDYESVLGVNDSVKNFVLQAKDASNNNITNLLNQFIIKLSKHYGIFRVPDIYSVPDIFPHGNNTNPYILAGKSTPVLGIQEISWQEIYNFNVGDIFHFHGHDTYTGVNKTWNKISTVLSRSAFGNDSIHYTFEVCTDTAYGDPVIHAGLFDTISQSIVFSQVFEPDFINALPEELININDHSSDYYRELSYYSNQRQKKYRYKNYIGVSYGGCWDQMVGWDDEHWFADGLGSTMYNWGNMAYYRNEALVYYKKGSENWGTPVSTGCITIGIDQSATLNKTEIQVSPNPVLTTSEVILQGVNKQSGYSIRLYDQMGRLAMQDKMTANTYQFNRANLTAGLYFLTISDLSGTKAWRKKIILD